MKKVLLSLLLIGSVSSLFAQIPQNPNFPCPIDIKSNEGGGNCKTCVQESNPTAQPNQPTFDFANNGTAVVTLNFGSLRPSCIPKLMRVEDNKGFFRDIRCGLGNERKDGNADFEIEYCLFGEPSADNFFNQPDLTVTLRYECPGQPPVTIRCNAQGEQIPLPVTFRLFTAGRNKASVAIKWATSTETNNKGFNIQRNTRGVWETVAFVASQAADGNSASELNYNYTDANNFGGVSQYRIQQVDIDGRSKISEIRSVRGEAQSGRTVVYPNPSNEGTVNVVFDDAKGRRDVIVSDISGRVVKSWKGIVENTLRITNLMPGTYMLRIVNEANGQSSFEKVVINK